jgi:hypothetical protein
MGERHFVANLVRRGHAWHWRARVPALFRKCPDARLSLSFGGCDHKTAASLARHMNRRLHELKHEPRARMTTRDQLVRLMADERDAEMDRLDSMAMARKRYGKGHDVIDVQEDLIHAWAYRLLQRWGVAGTLTFDGDCAGRAMLEAGGVGSQFVPHIAEAFLSIQDGLRSPVFDRRIRERLHDLGIADSVPNRERGKAAFFEGRAEALFDYRARYAHVNVGDNPLRGDDATGHRLAERTATLEQARELSGSRFAESTASNGSNIPMPHDSVARAADYAGDVSQFAPMVEADHMPAPSVPIRPMMTPGEDNGFAHSSEARDSSDRTNPAAGRPTHSVDSDPSASRAPDSTGPVLPVSEMLSQFEVLRVNKGKQWTDSSARDERRAVMIFADILKEHGVTHSGQITQFHIGKFRSHLNEVPTFYGRSSRMARMTTRELRAEGLRLQVDAAAAGKPAPAIGLESGTVRKHIANLETFLDHIKAYGFTIAEWSFKSLRPPKPRSVEVRHQTHKPKPEHIRPIFDAQHFHGSHSWEDRQRPGDKVFHDSLYFVPMLFTYLGARRAELCGLATDDVYEDRELGPVIHIRANAFRSIKNIQSDRILPVPDELLRLNFLQYRNRLDEIGEKRMFPELFSHLTENDPGDRFYDTFIPIMQEELGTATWDRALHALRHGFSNTLKQAGVGANVIDDISGRLSEGETGSRYTLPAEVPLMRNVIAIMPKITAHIQPKPIRLVPWVERGENPPWARPPRGKL